MHIENEGQMETLGSFIYFKVYGNSSGIPIFILHGGPGFAHDYLLSGKVVWDKLCKNQPIVFYDQRGTGKSIIKENGGTCTLKDQLDDLDSLRKHLGYNKLILLGHSWGGYLGMAYTALNPSNVIQLILVDSAAPCLRETIFLQKYVFPEIQEHRNSLAYAVELGNEKAIELDTIDKFSMLCYSSEKKDEFISIAGNTKYNYKVNEALWDDVDKFDLNPEIKKFKQPTLVITGRFDMNVAPLVAYSIHKNIQNSRFEVFEFSGHVPFFEEPVKFYKVINKFIQNNN